MKHDVDILNKLGPVPFWRGERKCRDALEEIYRKAMARATQAPAVRKGVKTP